MEEQKLDASVNSETESGQEEMKQVLALFDRLEEQKKVDVDKHWRSLSRRLRRERFHIRLWHFVRTCAAILLLPVLFMAGWLYQQWTDLRSQPVGQIEVKSAYGTVSKVRLSDGSEVWLNSGSCLQYPSRFTGETRRVYLRGQAYFEVRSDAEHPFDVVTAAGMQVRAYGTEFVVQDYVEDSCSTATLASGSIRVSQQGLDCSMDLQPGEQFHFAKQRKEMNLKQVNLSVATAWKDGKIVFRRTPMEEVARQLSRHFNVDIQLVGHEVRAYSYSGTFVAESISEILCLLEMSAPIRCEVVQPVRLPDGSFSRRKVFIRPR